MIIFSIFINNNNKCNIFVLIITYLILVITTSNVMAISPDTRLHNNGQQQHQTIDIQHEQQQQNEEQQQDSGAFANLNTPTTKVMVTGYQDITHLEESTLLDSGGNIEIQSIKNMVTQSMLMDQTTMAGEPTDGAVAVAGGWLTESPVSPYDSSTSDPNPAPRPTNHGAAVAAAAAAAAAAASPINQQLQQHGNKSFLKTLMDRVIDFNLFEHERRYNIKSYSRRVSNKIPTGVSGGNGFIPNALEKAYRQHHVVVVGAARPVDVDGGRGT
ncbi:hypothetical protein SAMD00019534_044280, partial [Acytostelium subglobosum LB1]|uniref:hypothetical protein n=1 Tax=Acytostelium subglobosum LB1 TaxID=1410327 RepID=UPI000644FE7E